MHRIITDKDINRWSKYIEVNESMIQRLDTAVSNEDASEIKNILYIRTNQDFMRNIISANMYDSEIVEVGKKVLKKYSYMTGTKSVTAYTEPSIKPPKYATNKQIKQRQKSGKLYVRKSPKRYNQAEETFFINNNKDSLSVLIAKYNKVFPYRSKSAIKSKKYRSLKRRDDEKF